VAPQVQQYFAPQQFNQGQCLQGQCNLF
jgi:hypothetical protein